MPGRGPLLLSSPVTAHPLNRGLVCWLRGVPGLGGAGSKTWPDLTGRYPATQPGAVSGWTVKEQSGFGPVFVAASNQHAALDALSPMLTGQSQVVLAGWVDRTAGTYSGMMRGGSLNARFGIQWNLSDNVVYAICGSGSANTYAGTAAVTSAGLHHLCLAYDGNLANADRCRIWVNGRPLATVVTGTLPTTLPAPSGNTLAVGRLSSGTVTLYATGLHADWRVSLGRGWSDADALGLYDQARRGHPDTLRRYTPQTWTYVASSGGAIFRRGSGLRTGSRSVA